jgi:hypothetical protein
VPVDLLFPKPNIRYACLCRAGGQTRRSAIERDSPGRQGAALLGACIRTGADATQAGLLLSHAGCGADGMSLMRGHTQLAAALDSLLIRGAPPGVARRGGSLLECPRLVDVA